MTSLNFPRWHLYAFPSCPSSVISLLINYCKWGYLLFSALQKPRKFNSFDDGVDAATLELDMAQSASDKKLPDEEEEEGALNQMFVAFFAAGDKIEFPAIEVLTTLECRIIWGDNGARPYV